MNRLTFTADWMTVYIIAVIADSGVFDALKNLMPSPMELTALWDWSDEGPLKDIISLVTEADPFSEETKSLVRDVLMLALTGPKPLTELEL